MLKKQLMTYLRLDANNYEALSIKSSILNGKKDYAEAYDLAEKIVALHPDKPNGYIQSIPKLLTNKKIDESLELLSTGYNKTSDIQILKLKAELQIATGKMDDAISDLKGIDAKNADEATQLLLAKAYMNKKDAASSRQVLTDSIKQDEKRIQTYLSLAGIYFSENNPQRAIEVLRDGMKANPEDVKLGLSLAGYYEKNKDIDNAIKVYEDILVNKPDNLIVTNNLAAILSEHKTDAASLNRAKELADKIKDVEQPVIKDTVGWVYYKTGNYAEAVKVLEQVVAAMPEVQIFNYHLGMSYYKNGDKDKARTYLEKSLSGEVEYQGIEEARQTLKLL